MKPAAKKAIFAQFEARSEKKKRIKRFTTKAPMPPRHDANLVGARNVDSTQEVQSTPAE